jgi:hypothetical protein
MERLGHSFKRIDEMELMAEKTYKLVLDRYPTNAKLLKSYGKFLENVKVRNSSSGCRRGLCCSLGSGNNTTAVKDYGAAGRCETATVLQSCQHCVLSSRCRHRFAH